MRARNIKPSFFKNDDLGECHPYVRLLFIGLWCMAYKDGIVEYRPKKIKAEIFPYDDGKCDIEKFLEQLTKFNFISILEEKESKNKLILINNFIKHQSTHQNEKSSGYDDLSNYQVISGNFTKLHSPIMNDELGIMNDERGMMTPEKFGEFQNVNLLSGEHEKLIQSFGEEKTKQLVEQLSSYLASSGKKYKSHYATILNWVRKDGKDRRYNQKSGFAEARKSGETDWLK